MGTIAETIRKDLTIHDWDDPIFKAVIADPDGVPEVTIARPTDYNQGAISSVLEYTRQLGLALIRQMDLTVADDRWLKIALDETLGKPRFDGETNQRWLTRVGKIILGPRATPNALIEALLPYSSPAIPRIEKGVPDMEYSDLSYDDVTESFQIEIGEDIGDWVLAAISNNGPGTAFHFTVILQNTETSDLPQVRDIVDRLKAGGTIYDVVVEIV